MALARSLFLAAAFSLGFVVAIAAPPVATPVAAQSLRPVAVSLRQPRHAAWFAKAVAHILEGRSLSHRAH